MPATVADILRQTGLNDDDIQKLDVKIIDGFNAVLTEAGSARTAAETAATEAREAERRYRHMYETEIVPALNTWGSEKATLQAERDFYRSQNEGARSAGFIPKDAPSHAPEPPRGADGRYTTGTNPVPGSPGIGELRGEFLRATSEAQWASDTYRDLYETTAMPEGYNFYDTLSEATQNRLPFRDYFSQKYKLADKQRERNERKQKEHDDAIAKAAIKKYEKERSEREGSNPNLRSASPSQYASVRKAVESGKAKDPLMMSAEQRRQQTREMIRSDMAERESQGSA